MILLIALNIFHIRKIIAVVATLLATTTWGNAAGDDEERYNRKKQEHQSFLKRWLCFEEGCHSNEERNNNHITKLSFYEPFDAYQRPRQLSPLTNIDFIEKFPQLTELDLDGCHLLRDNYYVVGRLINLTKLNLRNVFIVKDAPNIPTLAPLASLINLTSLNLFGNFELTSIRSLVKLPLRKLDLSNCEKVRDFDLLGQITTLRYLNLRAAFNDDNVPYPTLDFLSSLTKLKILILGSNHWVGDINPLRTLKLMGLDLSGNQSIQNLSAIGEIITLKFLNIMRMPFVNDMSFLTRLPNLKALAVDEEKTLPILPKNLKIYS